jgi:threonyl-tRNA synthetase
MERFVGVLIEHYAGNFPLWLAPIQASVIAITDNQAEYAKSVYDMLKEGGIRVELDTRSEKIGYKIRDWENKKVPYMIILGEKEKNAGNISVRAHTKGDIGSFDTGEFKNTMLEEIKSKKFIH